jgi:hypothetical protein
MSTEAHCTPEPRAVPGVSPHLVSLVVTYNHPFQPLPGEEQPDSDSCRGEGKGVYESEQPDKRQSGKRGRRTTTRPVKRENQSEQGVSRRKAQRAVSHLH